MVACEGTTDREQMMLGNNEFLSCPFGVEIDKISVYEHLLRPASSRATYAFARSERVAYQEKWLPRFHVYRI